MRYSCAFYYFVFFKQKTAYEMRISDWSSDVCSSDLRTGEILDKLPYYGELLAQDIPPGTQLASDPPEKRFGKITNPTVHIGLRQLEKLVNAIIAVHGRTDQIVVELARELKLNEKDKEEHNRRNRRDNAAAAAGQKQMIAEGIAAHAGKRTRRRRWGET